MNTKIFFLSLMVAGACACARVPEPAPFGPVPSTNQVSLQNMETYAFLHYSLNTYTDTDWGYGNEDPALFNPSSLDAQQWARTCKAAGMKGIIFTAKHHCGFCMWPSAYTEYSVKNTPWKNGEGDVVRELAEACREEGLKFGIYLSPWDRNHAEYGREEYVVYFRNQLRELLSQYGDIFEVWFDGANGGNGWYGGADETRKIGADYYGWEKTYELVRSLQPGLCVWGNPQFNADLRWCGTEQGFIGDPNWATMRNDTPATINDRLHGVEDGNIWIMAESDVSIRPSWFYHEKEDQEVKSLEKMMDIYYKTVGRNGTLILNFPVTPDGLIHPLDSIRGQEFGEMVKKVFECNLAEKAKVSASNTRGNSRRFKAGNVLDMNDESYWATDDGVTSASLTFDFGKSVTFNRFMVQEYIKLGQRVKDFSLEYFEDGQWIPLKDNITDGDDGMTTIGRKRIICFDEVTTSKLRFTILDSKAAPVISNIGVYLAPDIVKEDIGQGKYSSAYTVECSGKEILIDLGRAEAINGAAYLPPQELGSDGIITNYSLYANIEGSWKKIAEGEFPNVENNPIWQDIEVAPIQTRLLKLEAISLNSGTSVKYEDIKISILSPTPKN